MKFKIFMLLIAAVAVFIFLYDFTPDGTTSLVTLVEMIILMIIQQRLIIKEKYEKEHESNTN